MQGTAGEARMNSKATFSYGLLPMDKPELADREILCILQLCVENKSNVDYLPGAIDDRGVCYALLCIIHK